jgi:hypothetical protein
MQTMQTLVDRYPTSGRDGRDGRLTLARARLLIATGRGPEAVEVMRRDYGRWLSLQPSSVYAAESLYWFGRAYQAAGDKRGGWMVKQAREQLAKSPVSYHRALAGGQLR